MTHPYASLPADRFWRTAVAERSPFDISELWQPRFAITPADQIVTAGSCFAQHFSRALVARGYRWLDAEPGPAGLTDRQRHDYHYGTFSFRTGNIYTPRMLRQWLETAFDLRPIPEGDHWTNDAGAFFDPLRPSVEPGGFVSLDELRVSRAQTLAAIRDAVTGADVFVFTLGLTEAWQDRATGTEYANCPGTIAGTFDPDRHVFVNHDYPALLDDLTEAARIMFGVNPDLRVLLTVSPVPLTATASGAHVLLATSHSKSLLRAVAGAAVAAEPRMDYFPSYEIIAHPVFRGMFFAPNQRSVVPQGVDLVMSHFFRDQARCFPTPSRRGPAAPSSARPAAEADRRAQTPDTTEDDDAAMALRCEEQILEAFAPRGTP